MFVHRHTSRSTAHRPKSLRHNRQCHSRLKLDQIKEAADVYSLGAILYTLLTGRPPFQADNPLDILTQVLGQEPVSPRLLNPKLPKDLETICLKCLEKEPHRRYGSAGELAADLQRFLGDEPIRARPIGNLERLRRWSRKQRRSVTLSAAVAAVSAVVVVGGLLTWYGYRQWRLGYVGFDTTSADSPYLVAEVFDEQDRSVSGLFTVPTQEQIPLPSDSYRLRLSASGRLSQDFQFFVRRGQREQFKVNLDDSLLWPTLQVERTYELADLEGRTDVILLNKTGFARLDGSSCREVWSVDLSADDHPVLADAPGFRWPWSPINPSGHGKFDQRPVHGRPGPRRRRLPRDLRGHGVPNGLQPVPVRRRPKRQGRSHPLVVEAAARKQRAIRRVLALVAPRRGWLAAIVGVGRLESLPDRPAGIAGAICLLGRIGPVDADGKGHGRRSVRRWRRRRAARSLQLPGRQSQHERLRRQARRGAGPVPGSLATLGRQGDFLGRLQPRRCSRLVEPMDLAERYTFDGWYLIWLWGAYTTGISIGFWPHLSLSISWASSP
ncbi:MAG: serine/threonine-protein kinase, partial [Pirellulaceae bacterium]